MTAEEVVTRLERARRSGAGWMGRCPAHDDRAASLAVAAGRGGRVLLFCHAGCSFARICAALGVNPRELAGLRR